MLFTDKPTKMGRKYKGLSQKPIWTGYDYSKIKQNKVFPRAFFVALNKFMWIFEVQYMPLNVITLGQTESDYMNQMITITDDY